MLRVTLDTNCLYDLEEATLHAGPIRDLIARSERGEIELLVPAISASERQRGGSLVPTFAQFQERLARAGLGCARLVQPLGYRGITFWDFCLWADESMARLERSVHEVLHPSVEFEYPTYCKARDIDPTSPIDARWRNAKCDVLVVWSHIHHGGQVLVTRDGDFLKRREKLAQLGAGSVVSPAEGLEVLGSVSG
ncbi:MAG TPA: hypothetical protein VFI16_02180 [Anaeromyxobacteraceae bacterium]|nr:hypothetical protein [Anaeromyxobacteraceae bacterium]